MGVGSEVVDLKNYEPEDSLSEEVLNNIPAVIIIQATT